MLVFICDKVGWPSKIEEKMRQKVVQAPRPVRRKRALTLPLELALLPWKRRTTESQDGCKLFRLPAEVRMLVYEQYFASGGEEIFVNLMSEYERLEAWRGFNEEMTDVLSLLQTCRRMYVHPCLCR